MPHFRDGTSDAAIWENINEHNEYRLPDDMSGQFVIDIGAHIGAFSYACLERGAKVMAFEPDKENYYLLCQNIKDTKRYFMPFRYAVWGSSLSTSVKALSTYPKSGSEVNTGGSSLLFGKDKGGHKHVSVCSIEDILFNCFELYTNKIDMLKLDCEYSEWSILPGIKPAWLDKISRVYGEYHEIGGKFDALMKNSSWDQSRFNLGHSNLLFSTIDKLVDYLTSKGYNVEHFRHGESNLGMFFANKRGQK